MIIFVEDDAQVILNKYKTQKYANMTQNIGMWYLVDQCISSFLEIFLSKYGMEMIPGDIFCG